MTDTLSLDGLTVPVADALRLWASELAKGAGASVHDLRTEAEDAPRRVRTSIALTVRLDVMLAEAQTCSLRLACQTALNIDPVSASNFDPLDAYGGTPLISPAKRVGAAQPG